jgi:hypothetical protein
MGENTLNWVHFEFFAHFSNVSSDILIESTNGDGSRGSEECVVSGKNSVGLFTFGFTSNNNGMTGKTSISINMGSAFNLDEITGGKLDGILSAW